MGQPAKIVIRLLLPILAMLCGLSGIGQEAPSPKPDLLSTEVDSLVLEHETIFDGVARLSQLVPMGFAVERELTKKSAPQLPPTVRFSSHIEHASVREVMDWLCRLDPRYGWSSDGRTVNLFPRYVLQDNEYSLNRKIIFFELPKVDSAMAAAVQAAAHADPPQQIALVHFGKATFHSPINLTFADVSLREAFNLIAQQLGPTYGWQFSGTEVFHMMAFHDYLIPGKRSVP